MAQSLRTENQQLRAQLVAASAELETLRGRVEQATQRLDADARAAAGPGPRREPRNFMEHVTLSILGREYRLACAPEEKPALLQCAEYVDGKMQAIKDARQGDGRRPDRGDGRAADRARTLHGEGRRRRGSRRTPAAPARPPADLRRSAAAAGSCSERSFERAKDRFDFPFLALLRELECKQSIVTAVTIKKFPAVSAQRPFSSLTDALCARLLGSRRGVIGTRLLNLNGVDSDQSNRWFRTSGRAAQAGNLHEAKCAGGALRSFIWQRSPALP